MPDVQKRCRLHGVDGPYRECQFCWEDRGLRPPPPPTSQGAMNMTKAQTEYNPQAGSLRGGIPSVINTFHRLTQLHIKKNADYSGAKSSKLFNFEFAESIVKEFNTNRDKVFAGIVGIKLARLASLLGNNRIVQNESVLDSFDDAIVYMALWKASVEQDTDLDTNSNASAAQGYQQSQKPASETESGKWPQ